MSYVILYRSDVTGGVHTHVERFEGIPQATPPLVEFDTRDEAIAYVEKDFSKEIPVQIVYLDEL